METPGFPVNTLFQKTHFFVIPAFVARGWQARGAWIKIRRFYRAGVCVSRILNG
jgi:hypothetical protein